MWRKLSAKEIWDDVFRFPENATVFLKLFATPLLFYWFLLCYWGGVAEEVS